MDRRILTALALAWFLVAGMDVYVHGFAILDQFFDAFQAEARPWP